MRTAARKDDNQDEIVGVLRGLGVSVQTVHQVGRGTPDILCGLAGANYLFEIKDGSKPPSKRQLTPDEKKWHAGWRGQVAVVECVDDALMELGLLHPEQRAGLLEDAKDDGIG